MLECFGPLLAVLQREFPDCRLEPVSESGLATIRRLYPGVPEHYLAFLREVGWGSLRGWLMLYSGPVEPDDIFDSDTAAELAGLVFFGDFGGSTILGFDTRASWRLVGVDHHMLDVDPEEAATVGELLTRRLADQ